MRRWLGDALRSAANTLDPPHPITIGPWIELRPDGQPSTTHAALITHAIAAVKPTPPHHGWIERILGHIFGWL